MASGNYCVLKSTDKYNSSVVFYLCSQKEFNSLISDWMLDDSKGETPETHPWKITESDLQTQKEKVTFHSHLRLIVCFHVFEQEGFTLMHTEK